MGGGGDDVVGQRQLTGAARIAAMNDAGGGVAPLDVAEIEMILAGELFDRQPRMVAEHDDGRDRQKRVKAAKIQRARGLGLGLRCRQRDKTLTQSPRG